MHCVRYVPNSAGLGAADTLPEPAISARGWSDQVRPVQRSALRRPYRKEERRVSYRLRLLDAGEHEEFLAAAPAASFLQTPGWAAVKSDWRAERLGWVDGTELVGAALVLYRPVPQSAAVAGVRTGGPGAGLGARGGRRRRVARTAA